ncbi:hypothetical protein Q9L58_005116 [Maublancomyces gigas]|uniref:Uncharacterized protein n=1 Tax=Discina gigas TaxID=1032678 RepID=A0ABR3GJ53_9PEZI
MYNINPLVKVNMEKAHWRDIVKARSERWSETALDMMAWEMKKLDALVKHRGQWETRWEMLGPEDAKSLKEAEVDMIAFFEGRGILEVDKRCWMVDHGYARMEQDQVAKLRGRATGWVKSGEEERVYEEVEVVWTGEGKDAVGMMSLDVSANKTR